MLQRLVFSTLSFLIFSTAAFSQETVTATIVHDDLERDYRLYIPASYTGEEPWPLVFNLHGYTSTALQQQLYSNMDAVADTAGFLVCYPNGIDRAWNVGWNFGSTADDVGFISHLIDSLADQYNLNRQRVYSCGMSNGGFMSYRLACELNNEIAAVASVTGSMTVPMLNDCSPGRAVPVLEIHGTADEVVPYEGQAGLSIAIDDVIQFWVEQNDCATEATVTDIPDTAPTDGSTATRFDYYMCMDDTEVSLIKIEGGGHTWPGAAFIIGSTNQDFAASPTIWDFFNSYALDTVIPTTEQTQIVDLHIFPNPSRQSLHLTLAEGPLPLPYRIYTLQGELITAGTLQDQNPQIDISRIARGAYYLWVGQGGQATGQLFVKE